MKAKKLSYTVPAAPQPRPTNEQIAALAHAIWIDRGCPVGCDVEHWLEAERQLNGGTKASPDDAQLDPSTAPAARIDRQLDRIVSPAPPRSATSL
jgi:hypothetical protein